MGQVWVISLVFLCKRGPKLTHLLFADDSLIFCKANPKECNRVMTLLSQYKEALGQKVNRIKTTIFFSKSTSQDLKNVIKGILGVQEVHQYEKYLGLPSLVVRGKRESFNYIKERVWQKP